MHRRKNLSSRLVAGLTSVPSIPYSSGPITTAEARDGNRNVGQGIYLSGRETSHLAVDSPRPAGGGLPRVPWLPPPRGRKADRAEDVRSARPDRITTDSPA